MQISTGNMLIASMYGGGVNSRSAGTDASAQTSSSADGAAQKSGFSALSFRAADTADIVALSPASQAARSATSAADNARTTAAADAAPDMAGRAQTTTAGASTMASGGGNMPGSIIDITV